MADFLVDKSFFNTHSEHLLSLVPVEKGIVDGFRSDKAHVLALSERAQRQEHLLGVLFAQRREDSLH